MTSKHILIVGTGSAGKRHGKNFVSLGSRISCMDPRKDRLDEIQKEVELVGAYTSLEEAFNSTKKIDGVAITSPPVFHVQQSVTALERGIPVLLEKPVSPDEASARELERVVNKSEVPLLLTYTYRWWPPLQKVRELLSRQEVGKLRHIEFVMSAHLADWHPWENYWEFFMASKDLGGGALLDESHWIDLMLWLIGKPDQLFAKIDKISDLKINTDDNVDMLLIYKNGIHITMHLDLYGRPHQKYIRFIGEEGTIFWTVEPNRIAVGKKMDEIWETSYFDCDRNDMFIEADKEFIGVLNGDQVKTCSINDGVQVLTLIEAARKSNSTGCIVTIK